MNGKKIDLRSSGVQVTPLCDDGCGPGFLRVRTERGRFFLSGIEMKALTLAPTGARLAGISSSITWQVIRMRRVSDGSGVRGHSEVKSES